MQRQTGCGIPSDAGTLSWRKAKEKDMIRRKKHALVVAVVAIVALATAVAGYAFWSTTGSGSGQAAAGTTSALTLHASFSAGIYPGGTKSVSFTADSTNPGNVEVGTVHLASVTASDPLCVVADFTMPDVVENFEVPNGSGTSLPNNGTLSFADTAISQDHCKSATITLNLTSN
jgi:hypothetical protein